MTFNLLMFEIDSSFMKNCPPLCVGHLIIFLVKEADYDVSVTNDYDYDLQYVNV